MRKVKFIAIFLAIMILAASNIAAKDLLALIGVGFNSQLSPRDINSVSIKYWVSSGLCLQGMLGFQMTDPVDEIDLGGKVLFRIKSEPNMNVYGGCGIGIANIDRDPGDSDTAFSLSGILGVEYFFSGLPNLGFSTELGLLFRDYDNEDLVGSEADIVSSAGIHYYF